MNTFPSVAVIFAIVSTLRAQFYAPETDFHDLAQRGFPVEVARVLAWQRNAAGAKITEVTFKVETTPEQETVWTLRWLDAAKQPVREKSVRYPESLLVEGPKYFREIFKQIAGDDWKIELAPPDDPASAFWQGADEAGLSRLEALTAAGGLIAEEPKLERASTAARLAGILVHGALPSIAGSFTIDSVLLSRAAAWLAAAEASSHDVFDSAWAPILFLAGREQTASALWTAQPAKPADKRLAAERLWNFLCRPQRAPDAFIFGAAPENVGIAMPLFTYASNMDEKWTHLAIDLPREIFNDAQRARIYEYKAGLAELGGVSAGRFGLAAPGQFLNAWESAMLALRADPLDDTTRDVFAKAHAARPVAGESDALAALIRLAPVLNLGLDQSATPLVPTAYVTRSDLIGYGWEMAGRQFGALHNYFRNSLGDRGSARDVADAALQVLDGCDVHFTRPETNPRAPLTNFARLQFENSASVHTNLAKNLPESWRNAPDLYLRRIWLRSGATRDAVEKMFQLKAPDSLTKPLLKRLVREGGASNLYHLVMPKRKFRERPEEGFEFPAAIDRFGLRESVSRAVPWALYPQNLLIWEQTGRKGNNLGFAQGLEKLCWENLIAIYEPQIFFGYVEANALPAAKRFYTTIVPFVGSRLDLSNKLGPARFMLAWWENDDGGMRQSMNDGATYSASDLKTQITYALHRGDMVLARDILNADIERYGDSGGTKRALKDYLALIPALKDPQHVNHAEALDGFPKILNWSLVQWILLKQAHLAPEEAIRFLGGNDPSAQQKLFIAFLKRDNVAFDKLYKEVAWKSYAGYAVLAALMRNELHGTPVKDDLPDLAPTGAKPLAEMIAATRGKR